MEVAKITPQDSIRRIVDESTIGVVVTTSAKVVYANRSYCNLLQREYPLVGNPTDELFGHLTEEGRQLVLDRWRRRSARETIQPVFELELIRNDGGIVWAEIHTQEINWEGQTAVISWLFDITERKLAEKRLRESERHLSDFMEHMPGGALVYDEDLDVKLINSKLRELYQIPYERSKEGDSLKKFLAVRAERGDYGPGDPATLVQRRVEQNYKSADRLSEYEEALPGGKFAQISRLEFGNGLTALISFDVTERKKAEIKLRESQELMTRILDNSPFGVSIRDQKNGKRIYRNNRMEELLKGAKNFESIDFNINRIFDDPSDGERFDALIDSRTGFDNFEVLCNREDGTNWWCSISGRPLPSQGEHVYIFWVEDVTERHNAALMLESAKQRAEESTEAKSKFLANMSHEIRTPLNSILGYTQLMQLESTLSDEQKDNVSMIYRSGEHLLNLINEVLEMSKIEAGSAVLNPGSFDLHGVMDDMNVLFKNVADEKQLDFRITLSDELPRFIVSDEAKLRQILINLIGNAMKFTVDGAVTVDVKKDRSYPVDFRFRESVVPIRIDIKDTGTGIPEDLIEKIFVPFEQANGSLQKGGTGLGLAICREFANILGGDVMATSRIGEGSCFSLTMLAEISGDAESAADLKEQRRIIGLKEPQSPLHVLIVDDKASNRTLLLRMLEPLGFLVDQEDDGTGAVAFCQKRMPDVILMDGLMPQMGGEEATRRIRALPGGDKPAIVVVTAGVLSAEFDGMKEHADQIVLKPFKDNQIYEAIGRHCNIEYVYEEADTAE